MSTPCRWCEKPILWAQTEDGRKMPLNPEPVPDGNVLEIGRTGATLAIRVLKNAELPNPPAGNRYSTHFQTCDHARAVRRRQAQTEIHQQQRLM